MNTGQMLITIGAIALLSLVILRVNTNFLNTDIVINENKLSIMALSLGSSLIEEAKGKAFDEMTDSGSVNTTSALSDIGPEAGEVPSNYNDFDDYDGLVRFLPYNANDPTDRTFRAECKVNYINPASPNDSSAVKTWHKKLTVTITSQAMTDTIRLSTVYSYFFFR